MKKMYLILVVLLFFTVSGCAEQSIHDAASQGDVALIEKLLDKGADVNAKDKNGKTPLQIAQKAGSTKVEKMIISKGEGTP